MSTYIVAEIGVNHNGNYDTACKLVDAAAEARADAVKFQVFWNKWPSEKKWELKPRQFHNLFRRAEQAGLEWFATPFGTDEMSFLKNHGMTKWKIPSGHVTNEKFLDDICEYASSDGEFILSTGMCRLVEIEKALGHLGYGLSLQNKITVLHCTSLYPTPYDQVNLRVIPELKRLLGLPVGLSDHTQGSIAIYGAIALGVSMIEKHITFNENDNGPDHKASLEPSYFGYMIKDIRALEQALGDGIKKPTPGEFKVMDEIRKSMFDSYS